MLLAADTGDLDALLIMALSIAASGEAARAAPLLERGRRARPDNADPCRDLETMQPRLPRSVVAGNIARAFGWRRRMPGCGRISRGTAGQFRAGNRAGRAARRAGVGGHV